MPLFAYRLLPALSLASALIAILALNGLALAPAWGFVAKPLTTVLIILHAWPRGAAQPRLAGPLRTGLLASLAGDVFLLWPEAGFLPGLLSFLAAHLLYLRAFCRQERLARAAWPFVLFALLAGAVLLRLWPGVPAALRLPVLVYVTCLSAMGAQSWVLAWLGRKAEDARRRQLLALGGLLFVLSDACLAANKFAGPLPLAALAVLPLYWSAQWCIANWLAPRR